MSSENGTNSKLTWDRFWFSAGCVDQSARIRLLLCVTAATYFLGSFSDVNFWYHNGGPLGGDRVAVFLEVGSLEGAAKWILSPLFLTNSLAVTYGYLVVGIGLAIFVGVGRSPRSEQPSRWSFGWAFAFWLVFVGWANRTMFVGGLAETLLSLALFASALSGLARPALLERRDPSESGLCRRQHWTAGFSQRLMAVQITIVGVATFVTMLAGRVWHNGIGAYALAAPAEDRTIDWTNTMLVNPLIHETLSHAILVAIPIGLVLAWKPSTNQMGKCVLITWCIAIAVLGSHWLYAATFAIMVLAIFPTHPAKCDPVV